MVGVPGRSKSCNTCRHRKIACGLETPQCANCVKANRVCAGYQRERIFIQSQGMNGECSSKAYRTRQVPTKISNSLLPAQIEGEPQPWLGTKKHSKSATFPTGCSALSTPIPKTPSAQPSHRQQLLAQFIHHSTPEADRTPAHEKGWLVLLLERPCSTRALEASLMALSAAGLGRRHDDAALVRESMRLYGVGLCELQRALWDPRLMYADDTLAACMALFTYEVVECAAESRRGLISHMDGCARLIQLRGAEAHCEGLGREIFLAFRLDGVVRALECNSTTYLAEQKWMEVPWKVISKSVHDQVVDVLVDIANLVGQGFKMIHLLATEPLSVILPIVNQCWAMEGTLRQLYNDFKSSNLGPLYWSKFSTLDNPADDPELGKVFPVAFHFPNLRVAHSCMLHWTALILLFTMLSPSYHMLKALQSDMSGLPVLEERLDIVSLTCNICQSVEYCLQDEMNGLGAAVAMIPLHIVIKTLKDQRPNSRELEWSKAVAQNFVKKGIRASMFIPV